MNVLYTVYIEVEYDRTNEGDYAQRFYSLDCGPGDLAFVSQLAHALPGNEDKILQVAIHHSSTLARKPTTEHFESVEKLLIYFGSLHFKDKVH
jgi:hypothetical protein